MLKKTPLIILIVLLVCSCSAEVFAAASQFDCSSVGSIVINGSEIPFNYTRDIDFITESGTYSFDVYGLNNSQTAYEIHFPIGITIESGDKYTLSYDMFFPSGLLTTSTTFVPGLPSTHFAGSGTWVTLTEGCTMYHICGSVTATATSSFSEIIFIPRFSDPSDYFWISSMGISLYDKDYTGAISDSTSDIKNNADKNAASIKENADKNASDIKANQDANTDKQIQANKDLYEQEKDETSQAGSDAAASVAEIPDKSEGFISAVGKLVEAMTYEGTQAKWTFPSITLPAIPHVMDEIVLNEPIEIDFNKYLSFIPSSLLNIMVGLFSCGLVVYCFKELYDTIQYVLTLRGGSDE